MKLFLLTLILAAFTTITFAQEINFGIKGGVNLSNQSLNITDYPPTSNLTGFHIGGILDVNFANFSIQPGVFYSTKGYQITSQVMTINQQPDGTLTYKTKLNYIEIPVNILYKVKVGPVAKIYLGGGPYFGYGVSGSFTTDPHSDALTYSTGTVNESFKKTDYGINFIAGLELLKKLLIDANYSMGVKSNYTSGQSSYNSGALFKNKVIGFSVGYLF